MQTTLEVRWILKGNSPIDVQHWFKYECPGQLLTPEAETREDLYAYSHSDDYLDKFKELVPNLAREEINLKLREGNLELKLRRKQFAIQTFTANNDCSVWTGRVEQWSKFNSQQITDAAFNFDQSVNWISVYKKRVQKSSQGVESELTQLETRDIAWWSIAFEMTTESNKSNNIQTKFFREAVEQAAKTYSGPKLLADNSCGYVDWLNKFVISHVD